MATHPLSLKIHTIVAAVAVAVMAVLVTRSLFSAQTASIAVTASVDQNCAITAAVDPALASTLKTALTTTGTHSVTVGTVTQSCNKKAGFTLTVTSLSCSVTAVGSLNPPIGAKLVKGTPGEEEYQSYSVTFTNPVPTPSTSGLLAASCLPALGREVSGFKVIDQVSTIAIVFSTGVNGVSDEIAGAGTFSDTLTFDMTVK